MFNSLDEHPLFKLKSISLNDSIKENFENSTSSKSDDSSTSTSVRTNIKIRNNQSMIDSNNNPNYLSLNYNKKVNSNILKSKSVSDLIIDNEKNIKKGLDDNNSSFILSNQNRIDKLNNSSSDFVLSNENINRKIEDDKSFPFPVPGSFIKSTSDISDNLGKSVNENLEPINIFLNCDKFYMNDETNERRLELLDDLIKKQIEYITLLKILVNEYYFNFKNNPDFNIICQEDREKIFQYVNEILKFQADELLPDLEKKQKSWANESYLNRIVCHIFFKHLKRISLYNGFVENLKESLKCLEKCYSNFQIKSSLSYIDMMTETKYLKILNQMKIEHPSKITLKQLLVCLQIWPDIVNKFLIAFESYVSVDHIEFKYYSQIIGYFNELATKAMESIEDVKRQDVIVNIQNKIGGKFLILEKKRTLVKEGPLATLSPHLGIVIRIYVILLNKIFQKDLIIICDQADSQFNKLKPKRPLDVTGISVSSDVNAFVNDQIKVQLPNKSNCSKEDDLIVVENGFAINVPCIQKVFKFYAKNLQEKIKWFNSFKAIAQANVHNIYIDRSNVGKTRPKMISEKLIHYCFKCNSEFSSINRKHHCKACGYIFCKICSKSQANLEYDHIKRSRICDFCYAELNSGFCMSNKSIENLNQSYRMTNIENDNGII